MIVPIGCAGSASTSARDIVHDPFPAAQAEVEAAYREAIAAAGRHDWEELRRGHLESPKFTKFPGDGGRRQDFEAMMTQEIGNLSMLQGFEMDLGDLAVAVYGEVAIVTAHISWTARGQDNQPAQGEGRMTVVWVNMSDGWKIVHEHASPFAD